MRFYSLGQLSNSEKSNILNKHKEIYNGYKQVHTPVSNEQPLYIQDFANDKEGITVDNSGNVGSYNNKIYMKESKEQMCSECGGMMYEGECSECGYGKMEGEMEEGIYDVEDLKKGEEFDYVGGDANLEEDDTFEYEEMESAFADELDEITGPSPLYSEIDFPAYTFKSDGPTQAKGPYHQNEELDEIDLDKLEKGKKYKYSTPSFEDYLEYQGDYEYPFGDKMYNFKGDKGHGHTMGGKFIQNFMSDIEDEPTEDYDEDLLSRIRKTKDSDIEDVDFEEIDEDIKESFVKQKNKINEMFNRMNRYN